MHKNASLCMLLLVNSRWTSGCMRPEAEGRRSEFCTSPHNAINIGAPSCWGWHSPAGGIFWRHSPSLCSWTAGDQPNPTPAPAPPARPAGFVSLAATLKKDVFVFWGPLPVGTGGLFSYSTSLLCSWLWWQPAHTVNPRDELFSALTMGLLNRASSACCDRFLTIITAHKAPSLLLNSLRQSHQTLPLPLPKYTFDIPDIWPE